MADDREIIAELRKIGLGERMAERVAEEIGYAMVLDIVRENPYAMMKIDGISFQRADKIALNFFSFSYDDKRRQKALIYKLLDDQRNLGHTYLPLIKLEAVMKKAEIRETSLLEEAVKSGDLILEDTRVYTRKMWEAEVGCAELLKRRLP